jgi:ankyrin repeat protein
MEEDADDTPAGALRAAAYNGNLVTVRKLLDEAVDPNVCDQWGRTALSLAAKQGHIQVVKALLAGGAWVDPHEDYDTHETPLAAAAENGHAPIVEILIAAGANPMLHVGVTQATAEYYARINGHTDIFKYLLKVMYGKKS